MSRVVHIIGNGDNATLYNDEPKKGLKLTCNLPPFPVENAYGTCMVDFKMMKAITEEQIIVPGEWILGYRPKHWMTLNPQFYMKISQQVKEFYLTLPKYAGNYTDFNCGHMATHYASKKFNPDEVHLYGFDSMFDFNLKSCSDFYLPSNRDLMHQHKLSDKWRPIWQGIFKEFPNINYILHHKHDAIKFKVSDNVTIQVHAKAEKNKKKS